MTRPTRARRVAAGQGDRRTFNGTERALKLTGPDSHGRLTVYESAYAEGVPHPLHIHHDAIESFYMLEGTCQFRAGDRVITAHPGSFLSIPRGTTHGLVPIGGRARALVFFVPAAMEEYWEELEEAIAAGPLDQAALDEIGGRHHVELVEAGSERAVHMAADRPLLLEPGETRAGDVKAHGADTSGAFGLVETVIPQGHSAPLHVHRQEDEAFAILAGTVEFVCGDERFRAERGGFVFLPRGVPHTFLGASDQPARVLVLMVPAGLEAAFADVERFGDVFHDRHVEVVGPAISA